MDRCLLDTDILSEYLKGFNPAVVRRAADYARRYRIFSFTSVTVHEILYGLEAKAALLQMERARSWMRQNDELVPNSEDYRMAASIRATGTRNGTPLELTDCLIASVAVRNNMRLVTGNTADFEAIGRTGISLVIDNWREHDPGPQR